MQVRHISAALQSIHAAPKYLSRKCNFFSRFVFKKVFSGTATEGIKSPEDSSMLAMSGYKLIGLHAKG